MGKVIVTRRFKEVNHDGHIYNPGDVYPAYGYKAVTKRINFLSEEHPKLGQVYLKEAEEQENDVVTELAGNKPKTTEKSKKPTDKE